MLKSKYTKIYPRSLRRSLQEERWRIAMVNAANLKHQLRFVLPGRRRLAQELALNS